MSADLHARAEAAGILPRWTDTMGRVHEVPPSTLTTLLAILAPAGEAPPCPPAVPFQRCPLPEELGIARSFGIGCGLWALRRQSDLGSGDFAALAELVDQAAAAGCSFLALLPLHARFPADPTAQSPYAPSSRRFLDVFAIAPDWVPEVGHSPLAQRQLAELRAAAGSPFVDPLRVGRGRLAILEAAFALFVAQELQGSPPGTRGAAFLSWRARQGRALEDHCRFDALQAYLLANGEPWSFEAWPAELRRPDSPAVEAFARSHQERVTFFAWLQWLAHLQLEEVQARARRRGMRLGLGRDLAVGLHPAGAAAWSQPEGLVRDISLGAPPDAFHPKGQDWGLAPFSPRHLLAHRLEPLASDFAANLEAAGMLRIDHVMGLERQFWIPRGRSPSEGAYVRFPFPALASRLGAEATARRALVVGEDLGTLPEGFRDRLRHHGLLDTRVLWFERTANGGFRPPRDYEPQVLAALTTHDLPTLRGFLAGRDIVWREQLGILDATAAQAARAGRAHDRDALFALLRAEGLLAGEEADLQEVAVATHALLARSRASLFQIQIEDLAGELEQPNLPGTVDGHPNWRRRLPMTVEALFASPLACRILEAVRRERPPQA